MYSVVSRAESFTAADLLILEQPSPVPAAEPASAARPVRSAKVVKHHTIMKALASQTRLAAIELCPDGTSFTATALQMPMRMSERRVWAHMKILCRAGLLQRRIGRDKRETEYFI